MFISFHQVNLPLAIKVAKDFKFNFVKPRKDWSIYGGWLNAYEPVNKGRLASTQEWKIEKLGRKYY